MNGIDTSVWSRQQPYDQVTTSAPLPVTAQYTELDAIPYPTIDPPIFLPAPPPPPRRSSARLPIAVAAALAVVLLGATGFAVTQYMRPQPQPAAPAAAPEWQNYVDFAKTFAGNLMTVGSANADADFQRLLDQSAGSLRQQLRPKRDAYVHAVTQPGVTVTPKVNAAALKHYDPQQQVAEVLVSASFTKTAAGSPAPDVKAWRMTITVEDIKGALKASNLVVVP